MSGARAARRGRAPPGRSCDATADVWRSHQLATTGAAVSPSRAFAASPRPLIHQPTGGYQGQSSDIEIHARETLALRAQLDRLYARHTGQSAEQITPTPSATLHDARGPIVAARARCAARR